MSCYNFNKCYLPRPTREWSRVQNSCSVSIEPNIESFVRIPYTGKIVPVSELPFEIAMLNKGNILQYKKNSSNLTKKQRYSRLARGLWVNKKTWATQSTRGYTNPNIQNLQRIGAVNITLDGNITERPISCNLPIEVIQDLGILNCRVQENLCTGELITTPQGDNCYVTSDSDVPGQLAALCWNDSTPTWYPRTRYIMTNSGNKWPTNAPLFSAIIVPPPIITSIISDSSNNILIQWVQDYSCLPITNFTLFQNNIPIEIFNETIFSYTINNIPCGNYNFYLISTSQTIKSEPSNTVNINIPC
jgi:hypothetical protein